MHHDALYSVGAKTIRNKFQRGFVVIKTRLTCRRFSATEHEVKSKFSRQSLHQADLTLGRKELGLWKMEIIL